MSDYSGTCLLKTHSVYILVVFNTLVLKVSREMCHLKLMQEN